MPGWEKPNFGEPDRAHFDFDKFSAFELELEQEVAQLSAAAGIEPYSPPPKVEKEPPAPSERELMLSRTAAFLADSESLFQIAS